MKHTNTCTLIYVHIITAVSIVLPLLTPIKEYKYTSTDSKIAISNVLMLVGVKTDLQCHVADISFVHYVLQDSEE